MHTLSQPLSSRPQPKNIKQNKEKNSTCTCKMLELYTVISLLCGKYLVTQDRKRKMENNREYIAPSVSHLII